MQHAIVRDMREVLWVPSSQHGTPTLEVDESNNRTKGAVINTEPRSQCIQVDRSVEHGRECEEILRKNRRAGGTMTQTQQQRISQKALGRIPVFIPYCP